MSYVITILTRWGYWLHWSSLYLRFRSDPKTALAAAQIRTAESGMQRMRSGPCGHCLAMSGIFAWEQPLIFLDIPWSTFACSFLKSAVTFPEHTLRETHTDCFSIWEKLRECTFAHGASTLAFSCPALQSWPRHLLRWISRWNAEIVPSSNWEDVTVYGVMNSSMVQRPAAVRFKLQFRFTFCSVHQVFSLVLLPLKRLPHVLAVHDVLHEFVCQGVFAVLKLEYGRIVWPKLRIVWPAPILTTKAAMRWTASLLWRLPTTISARCTGEWQCSGLSYGVK